MDEQEVIYKYELNMGYTHLTLPIAAEVLCVQAQYDTACIWAKHLLPTNSETEVREFVVIGTGHFISANAELKYIGTFQLYGGTFVGHAFEVIKRSIKN